jgi:hypothetical protein
MPRRDRSKHKRIDPRKDPKPRDEVIVEPSRSMRVDTTTSAYGDAGRGRPVPKYGKFETPPTTKKPEPNGGEAKVRGMGAAITGGKFEGVF